jgi:hypothetical protein
VAITSEIPKDAIVSNSGLMFAWLHLPALFNLFDTWIVGSHVSFIQVQFFLSLRTAHPTFGAKNSCISL